MDSNLLASFLLSPLVGAALCFFFSTRLASHMGFFIGLIPPLVCAYLWCVIDPQQIAAPTFFTFPWIPEVADYSLAVNGLNLPFLAVSQIVVAVALWQNRQTTSWLSTPCLLFIELALMAAFTSQDFLLFAAAAELVAFGTLLIAQMESQEEMPRFPLAFAVLSSVFLLLPAVMIGALHFSQFSFFSTQFSELRKMAPSFQEGTGLAFLSSAAFCMLIVSTWVRACVVPCHFWLPVLLEHRSTSAKTVALGTGTLLAVFCWTQWIMPIFPGAYASASHWLCLLTSAAALYSSILALTSRTLRSWLAATVSAQGSFALFGLSVVSTETIQGSFFHTLAWSLMSVGLLAFIDRFHRLHESDDPYEIGSLIDGSPRSAILLGSFLFFLMAIPGSAFFVSSLLVLSGVFLSHPWLTMVTGIASVFVVCSAARIFLPLFSGKSPYREIRPKADLSRIGLFWGIALLFPLLFLGFVPSKLREKTEPALKALWQSRLKAQLAIDHGSKAG